MRHELLTDGRLGPSTVTAMHLAYAGHTAAFAAAAENRSATLPISARAATPIGAAAAGSGLGLIAAGMGAFAGRRQVSAMEVGELVTDGVYG